MFIMILKFIFFKILLIHIFLGKFGPKTWSSSNWLNWNSSLEVLHFKCGMTNRSVSYDSWLLKRLSFIFGFFCLSLAYKHLSCLRLTQQISIHQRYHIILISDKLNYIMIIGVFRTKISMVDLFVKIVKGLKPFIDFCPR